MILWRPVGLRELALVFEAGMKAFPPRLPEQPIFYPVLVEAYADQIARAWNTAEDPFAGYVVEMEIPDDYAGRFTAETVGAAMHRELWVPAEELPEFNRRMTKPLLVRRAFFGAGFRGHVPESFGLHGGDAYQQIQLMIATMNQAPFGFLMETSTNALTVFLNFPFWKAAGAGRLGVDGSQLARCLDWVRTAWSQSPRPAALLEDAAMVA
jgi:hypothetical protein